MAEGAENDRPSEARPRRRASVFEIRRVRTQAEYRACEELQSRVWGEKDFVRVPALVLITAQGNGGMALGAFGETGRLVGFVCSFPGLTAEGKVKQCSQLLAVDPELQGQGIGFQLKLAQREVALGQGLDLITWTFDPLLSLNAHFNVAKLGCTVSRYVVDCYGTPEGGLNGHLSTDRLIAEWWIKSPSVGDRVAGVEAVEPDGGRLVNEVEEVPGTAWTRCRSFRRGLSDPQLLVEIPSDLKPIKKHDLELARSWRRQVREIFSSYFARAYRVTGFSYRTIDERNRPVYRLVRETESDRSRSARAIG